MGGLRYIGLLSFVVVPCVPMACRKKRTVPQESSKDGGGSDPAPVLDQFTRWQTQRDGLSQRKHWLLQHILKDQSPAALLQQGEKIAVHEKKLSSAAIGQVMKVDLASLNWDDVMTVIPNQRIQYVSNKPNECVWVVNFADQVPCAYWNQPHFAQDEVMQLECSHLIVLKKTGKLPKRLGGDNAFVVAGIPRYVDINTSTIYGNKFENTLSGKKSSFLAQIKPLVQHYTPPQQANILLLAAPALQGQAKRAYELQEFTDLLAPTVAGYQLAKEKTANGTTTVIGTGQRGCGAFGGSKVAIALAQAIAAHQAGVKVHAYVMGAAADWQRARQLFLEAKTALNTGAGTFTPKTLFAYLQATHAQKPCLQTWEGDGN